MEELKKPAKKRK